MNALGIHKGSVELLAGLLLLAIAWPVWADASDDAVFRRYSRKVTPGKIAYEFGMKFTELTHPGTQRDVDRGAAVFTFEGLGASHVWKLPACPIFCQWPSLKDYPFEGQSDPTRTNFNNYGYVCQAEELEVNGDWKRYFGFVCEHGVAVVPAEEVYLSFNDCGPVPRIAWDQLPGGTDLGLLGPDAKTQDGEIVPVKLNAGDPLRVENMF
jgi:hypothetical protein